MSSTESIVTVSSIVSGKKGSFTLQHEEARAGMSYLLTSFFLVAQMAGAGFLALARAIADAGWFGIPMMIILCISIGFSGTRLGYCWVILEERWPQYRTAKRQPYMDIAERSLGKFGRHVAFASVVITLIGATTVFLILIADFISSLFPNALGSCSWVIIAAAILIPFSWLGTPKDFWQASVMAVVATAVACIVIFIQLLLDMNDEPKPEYSNPTINSFFLGFGSILFSFGGASVFPTIQNDMAQRNQFWKSVMIAFSVILSLYLPVATLGYVIFGDDVSSNILLYDEDMTTAVKVAVAFEIINLLGTYLIAFNPAAQALEELIKIPKTFGWKRICFRTSAILLEVVICMALPDFGLILNLIGGSTVTMCSFVLPPLMYMKLVDNRTNKDWPKRSIPLWERVVLWEIIIVGVIGGITSTYSAVDAIVNTNFQDSCFADFN